MKLLKKPRVLLVTAAAVLALAAGAQSALAYFTTYATAKGGYTIRLGETTSLEESFANWTKRVRVSNTGSLPCYVRVRAFCGSRYTLTFTGEGWTEGADGCWYYNAIVPAGGASSELDIAIGNVPGGRGRELQRHCCAGGRRRALCCGRHALRRLVADAFLRQQQL